MTNIYSENDTVKDWYRHKDALTDKVKCNGRISYFLLTEQRYQVTSDISMYTESEERKFYS